MPPWKPKALRPRSTVTGHPAGGAVLIPTGAGASATAPGASPGLAVAGAAALAAGTLLVLGRRRRETPGPQETR